MGSVTDLPGPDGRKAERARIARELRDSTGALVEGLQLQLAQLCDAWPQDAGGVATECDEVLAQIIAQLDKLD